jgi:hypothetical protein
MSLYPPPPKGWDTKLQTGPVDAAESKQALATWAQARHYELSETPEIAWYQGWAPFVYLFAPTRLGREVHGKLSDALVWLVEAFNDDEEGPDDQRRYLIAFVTSPKLSYRAAIKSRIQKEQVDEMRQSISPLNQRLTPRSVGRWRWREREQFLKRTYGRMVRGILGDAIFEAHCEIATPSREEGLAALPVALRHLLVQGGWRGILEFRPGGMVMTTYGPPMFDPASLDAALNLVGQIYTAATRNQYPAPPPSSGPVSPASTKR